MTTPISFELAKLLKEKDIVIYSIFRGHMFHWYRNGEKDEFGDYLNNNTGEWELANYITHTNEEYLAPTIAEVVMWLYEKHGIWIEVRKSYLLNKFVAVTKNPRVELSSKDTPTEAYEAAIEYCLTNLI